MKLVIPFLVVFSYFEKGLAVTDLPVMSRIPDLIQEFCPGANVCSWNQTSPALNITFEPGHGSCCTDCSCSADCEERGDCCFPQTLPRSNSDEVGFEHTRSTCLFPMTMQPNGRDRIPYQSYYMISQVPESDKVSLSNTSCDEVKVAPWGSLYPVYSTKKKLIYKNIVCATADDVTDGQHWGAVLVCNKKRGFEVLEESLTDNCKVYFIYQGNMIDIDPLKCYSGIINTCPVTGFEITDDISLSKEDLIELCSGGLVSPFQWKDHVYANVFCHICNGEYFLKNAVCQKSHNEPRIFSSSFVGLIDGIMLRDHSSIDEKQEVPTACVVTKNDHKCRALFCPFGQIRTQTGECKYLSTIWYDQEFTVFIKLKSDMDINIDDVFQVSKSLDAKLPPFKTPWPSNWFIRSIHYETVNGERSSRNFLVILKTRLKKAQPEYLIRNVTKAITKDWLLETLNKTLVFKSSFMPFTTTHFIEEFERHGFPRYELIYRRNTYRGNVLWLTKLYLCEQVELTQSEVALSHNNNVLFNNITERYLLNGEFTPILSKVSGGNRVRVCVEDSGLYETKTNVRSDANSMPKLLVCSYFAVTLLHLVNSYYYSYLIAIVS